MIEIKNLKQKYYRSLVLDGITINLPRYGIIGILGRSGSGKSTFLKVLAGLLSFEGHIRFQDFQLQSMTALQRLDLRLIHIGLLYQSYRLFEHESVAWNVALPLRLLGYPQKLIARHVDVHLKQIGLLEARHQIVNTLSGGEKQRLALVRALIKQPRVLLADEPTAALDQTNKTVIFDLLSQMKGQRLIIVVSHEQTLLERYADTIYQLEDGKIINSYQPYRTIYLKRPTYQRLPRQFHRGSLSWSFCLHHARDDMKTHRWRHRFAQLMLTIALLGTGVGLNVATAIQTKMTNTFDNMMGGSALEITTKQRSVNDLSTLHGAEKESVFEIRQRYADYDLQIAVTYLSDINSFFPDRNQIFLTSTGPITGLPSFQAQHFADVMTFTELGLNPLRLANDEIYLSVPETDLKIIARHLKCEANESSINQHLEKEEIFLGAGFANLAWQYEDEQLWRLIGITTSERALVIHSSPCFNEFVFETSMRFPSSHDLQGPLPRPWVLRKVFSLLYQGPDDLLTRLSDDIELSRYRFDKIGHQGLPSWCPRLGPCHIDRFLVLFDPMMTLTDAQIAYIQKMEPHLGQALIGTEGGYLLYPEAMISGFAHETFLAGDQNALEQAIDWFSWTEPNQQVDRMPEYTARGYYQNQSAASVRLRPFPETGYQGWPPTTTSQIAISSGLADILYGQQPELGTKLHYATRFIVAQEEAFTRSEFHSVELELTAIVNDERIHVYGCSMWSKRFFIDQMGISHDLLRPLSVLFESEEEQLQAAAARIQRQFPQVDISFPQADLHRQISEVTTNINYAVIALAGFAGLNALVLALLVANLSWLDMSSDRRLLFELGASKDVRQQLMMVRMVLLFGTSLLMAIMGVIGTSLAIEKLVADYFSTQPSYTFPLLAIATMIGLTFILGSGVVLINHFRREER